MIKQGPVGNQQGVGANMPRPFSISSFLNYKERGEQVVVEEEEEEEEEEGEWVSSLFLRSLCMRKL